MTTPVAVKKLRPNAKLPTYGSEFAAGADLYACPDGPVTIPPHETVLVPTGLSLELPVGWAGMVFARSGMAAKRDLAPANKVGVIDCDYRGEVMVSLHNHGTGPQTVEPGERIAQLVILPYLTAQFFEAEALSDTVRGTGGFGSTGFK